MLRGCVAVSESPRSGKTGHPAGDRDMLEIRNLVRNFGPLVAVDDVSFSVGRGEVLGFLGPNGAGKSTTMKMITGFLAPTSGTAIICGYDILTRPIPAKRCIGYLPEGAPAYPDMTAAEFLAFVARVRGFAGREAKNRIAAAVEKIHIGDVLNQPIETLSKGYRRRVGVAQALLHDPQVLILDEPTDGLDPNQKYEMRNIITAMAPEKAIIISTHLLDEVEAVCSRAIIIARGRVLLDGTPADLIMRSRYHNAVRLGLPIGVDAKVRTELENLPDVETVEEADDGEGHGLLVFPREHRYLAPEIAELARTRNWKVSTLRVERGRLDDVFRSVTAPEATPNPA
jgi:ABC-2 type transport system ATP-binding protein